MQMRYNSSSLKSKAAVLDLLVTKRNCLKL